MVVFNFYDIFTFFVTNLIKLILQPKKIQKVKDQKIFTELVLEYPQVEVELSSNCPAQFKYDLLL